MSSDTQQTETQTTPCAPNPHCLSPSDISTRLATSSYCVSLSSVEAAARRLVPHAIVTPVHTSSYLSSLASAPGHSVELFFKCELFQKVGAFKFRGALNAARLVQGEKTNEENKQTVLVTHSSGNHAMALALAARLTGARAVIVMPSNAPNVKKASVIDYGAQVIECEPTQAAREAGCAHQLALHQPHGVLVAPYDEPMVIAGQGTIALELLSQVSSLDCLIVPVGGGGMTSGICIAAKSINPYIQIIAAEPLNACDAFESLATGMRQPQKQLFTIADGLRTSLGEHNFPIIRDCVREVILVDEPSIVRAMRLVWERMKLLIEPSAAVGVAVALSERFKRLQVDGYDSPSGHKRLERVGIILCGGNVDLDQPLPWAKKA